MYTGTANDRLQGGVNMRHDIDPVVEEIRETRRKLYERCGNDPHKYGEFIAAVQRKARLAKKRITKVNNKDTNSSS